MSDPETARQAVADWRSRKAKFALTEPVDVARALLDAGDALAVLVPQLLDQLADERALHDMTIDEWDSAQERYGAERVAHAASLASVLDQLAASKQDRDDMRQVRDQEWHSAEAEIGALGERCRQLETALAQVVKAWTVEGISPPVHRAAKDKLRREWPTLHHAVSHAARAALGDTPPPGVARSEPNRNEPNKAAVEPPQPSPETERHK